MAAPAFQLWPAMPRVEPAAWGAIVKCTRAAKLGSLPLPIPVELWIEGPLDIQLVVTDLSHLGNNVLGAAHVQDREIHISQTLVKQEARFRFTAAHELGHIMLHGRIAPYFRDTDDGDFMARKIEREADRFAAAFLMPIPALCVEYANVAREVWHDPHSLLTGVARGDADAQRAFRTLVLPHLTKRFEVSPSAALRRFSDVQLPNGEPALPFEATLPLLPAEQLKESVRAR